MLMQCQFGKETAQQPQPNPIHHCLWTSKISKQRLLMDSLVGYGSSSESGSSSSSDEEATVAASLKDDNCTKKLPPPNLDDCKSSTIRASIFSPGHEESVFTNPFLKEEEKRLALLSKHVQLTETIVKETGNKSARNGVQICYKFQKGNCRFGDKCKYLHASEEQMKELGLDKGRGRGRGARRSKNQPELVGDLDALFDEDKEQQPRLKRPGLSQGLIPSKKVFNLYNKHRR